MRWPGRRAAWSAAAGLEPVRVTEFDQISAAKDQRRFDAEMAAIEQTNRLRLLYARGMFGVVALQLGVADGIFIAYLAGAGRPAGTAVDPVVMEVFLAATVVQAIGIVLVITRGLFPEEKNP